MQLHRAGERKADERLGGVICGWRDQCVDLALAQLGHQRVLQANRLRELAVEGNAGHVNQQIDVAACGVEIGARAKQPDG